MSSSPSVSLLPVGTYDFSYARTYFTRRAGELVDRVEDGVYQRLFDFRAGAVLASVTQASDGTASLLLTCTALEGFAGGVPAETVSDVAATLRRTLGLDEIQPEAEAWLSDDQNMARLVNSYPGLRLVSTPTAFEALVWAVIGQQISLQVAFKLKAALVQRCGHRAAAGDRPYWSFPQPVAIAEQDPQALAALGLGRRKAATIVATARALVDGSLDLEALAALPTDGAERRLVALHGVGPWTAQYTLLRGLRKADACPVSDIGLRTACGIVYGLGRKASVAEVDQFAQRWRPYRGTAAFFLWFMLADHASGGR